MSTRHKLLYAASVAACFLIGCIAALALQAYDAREASSTPLPEGQTIDFSAYGFTLTVPETYSLNDYTANNLSEGDNALFAGCTYDAEGELYIFCYANEAGDRLTDYDEQEVFSYYIAAGLEDVRTRTLGGRRFVCYRADVQMDEGTQVWYTYETWDANIHLRFETRMTPSEVLPILATIAFTDPSAA